MIVLIVKICFAELSKLRKKCPCSKFFWSVFSRIWTEYGEILRISLHSVRIRENTDQKNSEHGHFPRSARFVFSSVFEDISDKSSMSLPLVF